MITLIKINACEYRYGKWFITYNPKPIPPRCGVDWDYTHEDYDGDGDPRHGNAASLEACVADIDEEFEGADQC